MLLPLSHQYVRPQRTCCCRRRPALGVQSRRLPMTRSWPYKGRDVVNGSATLLARCSSPGQQQQQQQQEQQEVEGRSQTTEASSSSNKDNTGEKDVSSSGGKKERISVSGRSVYRPSSYRELVQDASGCVLAAMADGHNRLEVEFPGLPVSLEGYKGSSSAFVDANVQYCMSSAKLLAQEGKKVRVLLPDRGEYQYAYKNYKSTLDLEANVSLGHLKEFATGGFDIGNIFGGNATPQTLDAAETADIFIITNVSCVELPTIQNYVNTIVKDRTTVLWNLELETLRGDLGLFAFPPRDLHRKPVYFLRARDYSKSVAIAPFIINYSGALLREYPGPWQVMLRQDNGDYACVAEDEERYHLGEVKQELLEAMGLDTEAPGSTMEFLRRGYKTSTWWEEENDREMSSNWRS